MNPELVIFRDALRRQFEPHRCWRKLKPGGFSAFGAAFNLLDPYLTSNVGAKGRALPVYSRDYQAAEFFLTKVIGLEKVQVALTFKEETWEGKDWEGKHKTYRRKLSRNGKTYYRAPDESIPQYLYSHIRARQLDPRVPGDLGEEGARAHYPIDLASWYLQGAMEILISIVEPVEPQGLLAHPWAFDNERALKNLRKSSYLEAKRLVHDVGAQDEFWGIEGYEFEKRQEDKIRTALAAERRERIREAREAAPGYVVELDRKAPDPENPRAPDPPPEITYSFSPKDRVEDEGEDEPFSWEVVEGEEEEDGEDTRNWLPKEHDAEDDFPGATPATLLDTTPSGERDRFGEKQLAQFAEDERERKRAARVKASLERVGEILTQAQLDALILQSQGLSSEQIAERLGKDDSTVRTHQERAHKKLAKVRHEFFQKWKYGSNFKFRG